VNVGARACRVSLWSLLSGCVPAELLDVPIWVETEVVVGAKLCDRGDEFRGGFTVEDRASEVTNRNDEAVYVDIVGGRDPGGLDAPVVPDLVFVAPDGMLLDRITLQADESIVVRAAGTVSCNAWGEFPDGRFDRQAILEVSTAWRDPVEQRVDVVVQVETDPL
jgi:hypothetical protein